MRKRRKIVCVCVIDDEYGERQEWKKREWGNGLTVCKILYCLGVKFKFIGWFSISL